ncbi:hypothetical protein KCP74_02585 [Salmonella enterica subsp. enterica]|nr:hypothetical protein KCP74_02585 [Salmonella enterica subsp. enterica]
MIMAGISRRRAVEKAKSQRYSVFMISHHRSDRTFPAPVLAELGLETAGRKQAEPRLCRTA